jgi:hypothetical protein
MKNSNSMLVLTLSVSLSLSLIACGNSNKLNQEESENQHDHSAMTHEADNSMSADSDMAMMESKTITTLIDNYLSIKNALVKDDSKSAASAGQTLADVASTFDASSFEESDQTEIKEILEVIKEHGEHIAKSELAHQREHFEGMAKDFMDLLAMAGTDRTLYQQYCPMYNKGKGGSWLSASEEIKNPLFGSKMLTCGSVKETISMK